MLLRVGTEIARVLYEGAFWIALGFAAAGLLHEFLPRGWVARRLGGESASSALWGAVLGAPIPLCSCGVLPAAAGLRRAGASRSSLGAFLVSTPETGMDSIALSYALLGPVMAWVRPVVAVVSGIIAGCVGLLFRDPVATASANCAAPDAPHDHTETEPLGENVAPGDPFATRLRRALRFGFGTLLDEIAFWLLVGLATTGLLAEFLPDHFFRDVLGWEAGLAPMLAMAVVGLPLYVCASASTPVAAALIAKGLSPGAALVFLLVGPATNAATLSVGRQILGTPRILACIASMSSARAPWRAISNASLAEATSAIATSREARCWSNSAFDTLSSW